VWTEVQTLDLSIDLRTETRNNPIGGSTNDSVS